ncbi:MAG: hypothetical protein ACOWWO_12955 [Peptococcaceae bacterium]
MEKIKAPSNGYAINSKIFKIIEDEGYAAIRILAPGSNKIIVCDAVRVCKDADLPQGADKVIGKDLVRDYGSLILIEGLF